MQNAHPPAQDDVCDEWRSFRLLRSSCPNLLTGGAEVLARSEPLTSPLRVWWGGFYF